MKRMEAVRALTLVLTAGLIFAMREPTNAQRAAGTPGRPSTITVMGSGEAQSKPDVASVMVGVVNTGKSAQEASQENANLTQQVIAAVRRTGVAEKDIQTSGYSVQPLYKNNDFSQGIVGYSVSNSVRATVRKLADVGKVIDEALAAGANNVQGVAFGLEKRDKAEDAATEEAVTNARRKADVIARAAGLRIVGVREISAAPREPRPMPMMESFRGGLAAATPVQPGELTITAQVTAVYEVAPLARRAVRAGGAGTP